MKKNEATRMKPSLIHAEKDCFAVLPAIPTAGMGITRASIARPRHAKRRALFRTGWKLYLLSVVLVLTAPAAFSQKGHRGREVCITDGRGQFVCINLEGINLLIPPAKMRELQQAVDEALSRLDLDSSTGLLTGCGGGRSQVPDLRVTQNLDRTDKRPPRDAAEANALVDAIQLCARQGVERIAERGGLGDPGQSDWVTQTIAKIDHAVSDCANSSDPMISQGGDEVAKRPPKEKNVTARDRFKVQGVLQPPPPPASPSASTPSVEHSALLIGPGSHSSISEAELTYVVNQMNAIDKNKEVELSRFFMYLGLEMEAALKERLEQSSSTPPRAQQGCRPGVECKPSCSDIQASWNRFKEYCDNSHWRDSRCTEFLRKVNGCISPTLVMPNPETGEMGCPGWAQDDAAKKRLAWKIECERRKGVMMPVGPDNAICAQRDVVKELKLKIDPCNDPRAMPGPDGCPGRSVDPGGRRPGPPRPTQDPSRPVQRPPDPARRPPGTG